MEEYDLVSHIEGFGLSNKEARVYLACLALGASSVQSIADKAGIKRVTAYVVLESLQGLGLVVQSMRAKKTLFAAEDPGRLEGLLERRANELSEQKRSLKEILPRLVALRAVPKESPEMKFYDGTDSVPTLFNDLFSAYVGKAKEWLYFSNIDELTKVWPEEYVNNAISNRVMKGIRSRLLYTSSKGPIYRDDDTRQLRRSRFVPAEKYPVSGNVGVLGDIVIMISVLQKRPVGISIRNPEMARSIKALFEMAWDVSGSFVEN